VVLTLADSLPIVSIGSGLIDQTFIKQRQGKDVVHTYNIFIQSIVDLELSCVVSKNHRLKSKA
jgi:hypothetical protein